MYRPSRLAIATSSRGPALAGGTLAILAALTERGLRVQHYGTQACLHETELVPLATGLPGRQLDAWLMPPDLLRVVFAGSARHADLAVIEGTLDPRPQDEGPAPTGPGELAPIASALDLPCVALVSCPGFAEFHLPELSPSVEAVILDGLECAEDFEPIRQAFENLTRCRVLGAVEALPAARAALDRESEAPTALRCLARSFLRFADRPALLELAASRPFPEPLVAPTMMSRGRRGRVAFAQDEAFGRYFPDTLETLEALGAELVDFSPLHDEALPPDCDLVILGCGYPDRHAAAIGANLSLISGLRALVCRGGRIYAEGGGMAYLGQELRIEGQSYPAAGVFPFVAELRTDLPRPRPVSRTLTRPSWLGPAGTTVRGYLTDRWSLQPAQAPHDCPARCGPLTEPGDMYFRGQAVGGLVHLHLAALPEVVAAFLNRDQPRPSLLGPSRRFRGGKPSRM